MKRLAAAFPVPENFLPALLQCSRSYNPVMVLNSNSRQLQAPDRYGSYEYLAAIGQVDSIRGGENCFPNLQQFLDRSRDWVFGGFSYDLKNQLEKLHSGHSDRLGFPDYHFFQPRYVLSLSHGADQVTVHYRPDTDDMESVENLMNSIRLVSRPPVAQSKDAGLNITCRVSKAEYIETANRIKQHIARGDIYEMNYCVEFYAEKTEIDPVQTFLKLNAVSPMPFSGFYHVDDHYLICASPERFLKKSATKIISQPIKGTAPRGITPEEDQHAKAQLQSSRKEQSENVMIVDLVRNDLSRTAKRGTVDVEELFGIYSFQTLHQMISTVVSEVDGKTPVTEVIQQAFPMGSMTGAPKIRAMELIEKYERMKRGLYSGSVGYFTPEGNFDLNVVIRSIGYHAGKKSLSYMAGSAITRQSVAESEYEECLLKARSMKKALSHD